MTLRAFEVFITDNPCVAEEAERTKRRWWGNKHKDNKWVAWLNYTINMYKLQFQGLRLLDLCPEQGRQLQAGQERRWLWWTRMNVVLLNLISVPFVPAMSPVEADHNPFEGEKEWRLVWDRAPALCAMNIVLKYLFVSRLPRLLLRQWAHSGQTTGVREHINQLKSIILCVENTSAFNLNTPAPRRNKFSPKSQSDYFYSFDKIFIIPLIPLW